MKIKDVIKMANLMEKGNVLEPELAIFFLDRFDGMLQSDVMNYAPEEIVHYTDQEQELILQRPHDGLYVDLLVAMIRQQQQEYEGYNNAQAVVNEKLRTFKRWYIQHYRPADTNSRSYSGGTSADAFGFAYLTAYGLAVRHGYQGTEEEWLRSLEGQPGAPGEAARMRFDAERGVIQWGVGEQWYDLFTIEELKDPVVEAMMQEVRALAEQAGRDKEIANQAANTAAGYATAAGGHAKTAADAAADSLTFAGRAYASEQAAVTAAGDAQVQAETAQGYTLRAEAAAKKAEAAAKTAVDATGSAGLPTFGKEDAGKLLYIAEDGKVRPLTLGPGLEVADGALRLKIAAAGEGMAITVDADGIQHVSLDGVEIPMQVDGDGYAYWPGLTASVDADGYIVLERS